MNERNLFVNCLARTNRSSFRKLEFQSSTLENIAREKIFQKAKEGEYRVTMDYEDPNGVTHKTNVVDILVSYHFGVYLENKNPPKF